MRTAEIYVFTRLAGTLTENDDGRFVFLYDASYLREPSAIADSLAAHLDDVLVQSPLTDEFATKFKHLAHSNLNRISSRVGASAPPSPPTLFA